VTKLPQLSWKHAFGPCICETRAPYLTALEIGFEDDNDEPIFPSNVLEAAPALERIAFESRGETMFDSTVLQAVKYALRHDSLQNLVEFDMEKCDLGNGAVRDFTNALKDSECAKWLKMLSIECCDIVEEDARALADLLCQDALPALEDLCVQGNSHITDVGVVALFAECLLKSMQNSLIRLYLSEVAMGDQGIVFSHISRTLGGDVGFKCS